MMTYISLLRGINVGGHKKIKMADLRRLYEQLGLSGVQSYVQSGNVVFNSANTDRAELKQQIESAIEAAYHFYVPVLLRTAVELRAIVAANPFSAEVDDNKHQYVLFLDRLPTADELANVTLPANTNDHFVPLGDALVVHYANGAGRSKLTTNFFERKLGIAGTARNWRTVNNLAVMATA